MAMGYQPRAKTPKRSIHEYRRPLHELKKRFQKRQRQIVEEKHVITEQEIVELTLRRLHNLGGQRFGSFPFSEHFDRWLYNVEGVLDEFKGQPTIGVDEEFLSECTQVLTAIKRHLDDISHRETLVGQEVRNLADSRSRFQQINAQYASAVSAIRGQKNSEIRRLYREIEALKKEQNQVIKLKTGFFRGLSKKERERREVAVVDLLTEKQAQLELAVMDLKARQKKCRDDYDTKKEPVVVEIKKYQKKIEDLESDASLEERWFACEVLSDAVNSFLQRKAAVSKNHP
jgi:hypothetical protein